MLYARFFQSDFDIYHVFWVCGLKCVLRFDELSWMYELKRRVIWGLGKNTIDMKKSCLIFYLFRHFEVDLKVWYENYYVDVCFSGWSGAVSMMLHCDCWRNMFIILSFFGGIEKKCKMVLFFLKFGKFCEDDY